MILWREKLLREQKSVFNDLAAKDMKPTRRRVHSPLEESQGIVFKTIVNSNRSFLNVTYRSFCKRVQIFGKGQGIKGINCVCVCVCMCVCIYTHTFVHVKSYPRSSFRRPIGLWDVKDPTLCRQSAQRWQFTPQKHYLSASGTHSYYRLSEPWSLARMEGLGKFKTFIHLIGSRSRNFPTCSIVP
jgi:hypothetical protein